MPTLHEWRHMSQTPPIIGQVWLDCRGREHVVYQGLGQNDIVMVSHKDKSLYWRTEQCCTYNLTSVKDHEDFMSSFTPRLGDKPLRRPVPGMAILYENTVFVCCSGSLLSWYSPSTPRTMFMPEDFTDGKHSLDETVAIVLYDPSQETEE